MYQDTNEKFWGYYEDKAISELTYTVNIKSLERYMHLVITGNKLNATL